MSSEELENKMSEDLKAVLQECKSGNLAIVGGKLIEPDPDEVPFVLMMDRDIYNHLFAVAAASGLDPEEMVMEKISEILDIEKVAEPYGLGGESDIPSTWEDPSSPPPTESEDVFIGWGAGTLSERPNPSVENRDRISKISHVTPYDNFKKLVTLIHSKRPDGIHVDLTLGFHDPGEVELKIEYPEDGIRVHELEDGGLDAAFNAVNKHIRKFYDVAFSPKIDSDADVVANLNAKIVKFDKSMGKYLVQIGEDILVHVSPEDVAKL